MKKTHVALGLLAMAAFVGSATTGCSSDTEGSGGSGGTTGTGGADGGAGPGPGPGPGGGGTGGMGTGGGTGGMDESTSCADAPDMEVGQNQLGTNVYVGDGFLNNATDHDYWKFDATEGDWLNIITIANEQDDSTFIDTVIRLYDESGNTLYATDDDAYPRVTTDSEMFYHVPSTGTYCLEVLEWGEWTGDPIDKANNQYNAQVIPIDFSLFDGHDEESEPNDDQNGANSGLSAVNPQSNNTMSNFVYFTQVGGLLASASDTDWYELSMPATAAVFNLDLNPDGVGDDGADAVSGWGSTGGPGVINLYNSGGQLMASVDHDAHFFGGLDGMSSVPITGGQTYFLEVTKPDTNVGANDFYWLPLSAATSEAQNPQEANDNTNDSINTPEVMEAQMGEDGATLHFIGGSLEEGDTDYWSFPANGEPVAGEELVVVCSSWAAGSGVRGMTVTHYEDGNAGQSGVEDPDVGILWSNTAPNANGTAISISGSATHIIELTNDNTGGNTDTSALSKHYLCGVHRVIP